MITWTLRQAVSFVRRISPIVQSQGFYLGMTGSVLFHGKSEKDLDLLVYPASTARVNHEALKEALRVKARMRMLVERGRVHKRWRKLGSEDTKWVEVWMSEEGRLVDLFFVQ